jgi:hypothetical protein
MTLLRSEKRTKMTPEVYNQFALSLVDHIVERALGCDPESERIVDARPADHILAGFLTPVHPASESASLENSEELASEDLPQDRPHEQSAIGLEWLAPVAGLTEGRLEVEVGFSVYVRRVPTYEELHSHMSWNRIRNEGEVPSIPIIEVWTREALPNFSLSLELARLHREKRVALPFETEVAAVWEARLHELSDLYLTAQRLDLPLADHRLTPEAYHQWLQTQRHSAGRQNRYDWAPRIDARITPVPTAPDCVRLSLRLINGTPWRREKQLAFFDPNLYAVQLRVQLPHTAHHLMEFADLPRSYRYDRTIAAVGINANVEEQEGTSNQRIFVLQSIPRKQVNRLEPREITDGAPTFEALLEDPVPVLRRIHRAMQGYASTVWLDKLDTLAEAQREDANADYATFVQEVDAFERGIALLEHPDYPLVRQAFRLMNETMSQVASGKYDRWRLFQIIFIVIQLPRLASREYPALGQEGDDAVDILWFAAGGGKTEAFTGLLIWQMFFDRLRGKQVGVTALVRFPLRLLTFQQLQRMARVLGQAELIRKREHLEGARFSLGYFVGDNTRPNSIDNDRHARYIKNGPDKSLQSIKRCPFCQSKVVLEYCEELRLVEHYCARRETCPGGTERLPLYIVDADIYRYLPSVIVSTIDKLALIGQNQRFGNLFGRFHLLCGRHGASFLDTNAGCKAAEVYAQHPDDPTTYLATCEGKKVRYGPFHDPAPALLIQDELHLLSEETGTFDAHYETAALAIMHSLKQRPWKIIAATATIERFEDHVDHLYLKPARQFPSPGPGAYESFYYQLDPQKIGRIFVGILGIGRKHTPAVTRLLSLIYQELQTARDEAVRDLSSACQRYHLPPVSRTEFDELVFCYELVLTYVLTRKGSDQVAEAIQSRVKKELRELMPTHGDLLLEMLNGGVDMTEMLDTMESIESERSEGDPAERVRGVVATNIIGHGVDISRFNIIVFGGFTRLVAEYIQASARVGRTFPGISFLVVTPQSERDRSIFERFGKFHEYLDRLVDPSAINRWPAQALERTVPGILAGYLMTVAAAELNKRLETVSKVKQNQGSQGAESLLEGVIIEWVKAALGADRAPYPQYAEALETVVSNRYAQIINAAPENIQGWDGIRNLLEPMRSLRDIDDPAFIGLTGKDATILRNLLRP